MAVKKQNNTEIKLIQLNQYIRPSLSENKSRNWVLNGQNNSFYDYLINRYNGSPTHSAIINSYIDMIYAGGIGAKNAYTNTADWIRFKVLFKDADLKKIISDFVLFNEFSAQVIKAKNKKDLGSIKHLPKERTAPALENEDEEIESYWYCRNWANTGKFKPEEFSAFGFSKDEIEIYNAKPYKAGKTYFSDPDYLAGLPYCEMEEEIANYYTSHIKNGLSFGYIINIPDGNSLTVEEQDEIERKIKQKLTGSSNAGRFILSFNGREAEITVTPLSVNDNQHKQWEYLTSESRQQIMTSHRVVSPMLFGIKDNTGFGNNADELNTAREQIIKYVIKPKQDFIIEAIKEILEYYNINLDLYFKSNNQSQTALSLANQDNDLDDFLKLGENEPDGYDLVSDVEVDYDEEEQLSLASTGTAFPNAKSSQDGKEYIVRYRYTGSSVGQRDFCSVMLSANKIYRKEDIIAMGDKSVNAGWGPHGANTYSIWLYKGGGNCHHKWNREIYLKQGVKIDVNSPLAKIITTSEARRQGFKLEANDSKVSIEPRYMVNNGFLEKR